MLMTSAVECEILFPMYLNATKTCLDSETTCIGMTSVCYIVFLHAEWFISLLSDFQKQNKKKARDNTTELLVNCCSSFFLSMTSHPFLCMYIASSSSSADTIHISYKECYTRQQLALFCTTTTWLLLMGTTNQYR